MKHEGYNALAGNPPYQYKYNEKELQQETGWLDYGWRQYMPEIGKWNGMDQLSEQYYSTSPFAYVANNPISSFDVDGRFFNDDGTIDTSGTANGFVRNRSFRTQDFGQRPGEGGGGGITIGELLDAAQGKSNPGDVDFSQFDFTKYGASEENEILDCPKCPKLSNPIGKKVLEAKTSFLGRLWATGEPRTWSDGNLEYDIDADGRIMRLRSFQGDVPLGPAGEFKGLKSLYTFTKSAGKHFFEIIKSGENASRLVRPYMRSPLIIEEIISTGKGIPDATAKGAMNFRVPGTFRGSNGTWELVVDINEKLIYHFNFVK